MSKVDSSTETPVDHLSVSSSLPALADAWRYLMEQLGLPDNHELYQELINLYSEPRRGYHDVSHLEAVVSALMTRLAEADDPEALLLAAWFHDAYPPWKSDAERRSADLLRARLDSSLDSDRLTRVETLIMATADHLNASGRDAQLLVDADIWILGAPTELYQSYVEGVRHEYRLVPSWLFRRGRKRFISQLLKTASRRGKLSFHLDEAWERQAQRNLQGELSGA